MTPEPNHTDTIESVHTCYCQMTGLQVNQRVHERAYADFLAAGYTVADLELVLGHIKRENRRMAGASFSLRLDRLLDFDYRHFDSILSEARALQRNRVVRTPRQEVLQQLRKLPDTENTTTANTAVASKELVRTTLQGIAKNL